MSDLISRSELLNAFNNKNIQITFDLPVEEVLGEDVDLDDFAMLVQDAIQSYKKLVIDTIKEQPTAYDIDKVVEELENNSFITVKQEEVQTKRKDIQSYIAVEKEVVLLKDAIKIVKQGGVGTDDVCEWNLDGVYLISPHPLVSLSCITDDGYRYNYCPVCGKKIKAVE